VRLLPFLGVTCQHQKNYFNVNDIAPPPYCIAVSGPGAVTRAINGAVSESEVAEFWTLVILIFLRLIPGEHAISWRSRDGALGYSGTGTSKVFSVTDTMQ
jgi:hypothetical protein